MVATNMSGKGGIERKPISQEERQRRIEVVAYARASVRFEGLEFSEVDNADAELFINGEIDMDGYIALGLDRARFILDKKALDEK